MSLIKQTLYVWGYSGRAQSTMRLFIRPIYLSKKGNVWESTAVCHHPRRDRQIRWAFGTVIATGILHTGATFESIYLLWIWKRTFVLTPSPTSNTLSLQNWEAAGVPLQVLRHYKPGGVCVHVWMYACVYMCLCLHMYLSLCVSSKCMAHTSMVCMHLCIWYI